MVLRAFYFIRSLTKALTCYYINRTQCHLLAAIENNWFEGPILLLSKATQRCTIFATIQISRTFLCCYVAGEKNAGNSLQYCAPPSHSCIIFPLRMLSFSNEINVLNLTDMKKFICKSLYHWTILLLFAPPLHQINLLNRFESLFSPQGLEIDWPDEGKRVWFAVHCNRLLGHFAKLFYNLNCFAWIVALVFWQFPLYLGHEWISWICLIVFPVI